MNTPHQRLIDDCRSIHSSQLSYALNRVVECAIRDDGDSSTDITFLDTLIRELQRIQHTAHDLLDSKSDFDATEEVR